MFPPIRALSRTAFRRNPDFILRPVSARGEMTAEQNFDDIVSGTCTNCIVNESFV